jgi:hypothetical protein
LREAILSSNGSPDVEGNFIDFDIPGTGLHTIVLASPLPVITSEVTINGYTQPGSSPSSLPPGQGLNPVLTIEIDGTGAGDEPCIWIENGDKTAVTVIRGLVINRCSTMAILIGENASAAQIVGCFIGTDPTGSFSPGPQGTCISNEGLAVAVDVVGNLISGCGTGIDHTGLGDVEVGGNLIGTNAAGTSAIPSDLGIHLGAAGEIGDSTVAGRNIVSGNGTGIEADASAIILGNFVGTDVTGTKPLGNTEVGIQVGGADVTIGDNVISANGGNGISGSCAAIRGNFIGTDGAASLVLGNGADGILVTGSGCTIGGLAPGDGNVIANNHESGVMVNSSATDVGIRGNRIFANGALAIDLFPPGVTPNDPQDTDDGANHLQNTPLITTVAPGASTTHVEGTLNSTASTTFDIDLYADSTCHQRPQDQIQADMYLASLQITTDGSGNASFTTDVPFVLEAGQAVAATATDPDGNTSELLPRILASLNPRSGSAAGVTTTLAGLYFEPGAAVTVGGVSATSVDVTSSTTITATMPMRPAGSVNDVAVLNPSGLTGTLANGWLADFLDVPESQQFHAFVVALVLQGIASGVGGGNYGVDNPALRQQMAVLLLKAEHGLCYVPIPCAGIFADVPCPSAFADWIEALAAEGVTSGCGNGDYCPQEPVRRDQMAVFLLKGEHGSSYAPADCTGMFSDVPCPSAYAAWIEQLAAEGVTAGCGGGDYCPLSDSTRGQMAVFLVRTFALGP